LYTGPKAVIDITLVGLVRQLAHYEDQEASSIACLEGLEPQISEKSAAISFSDAGADPGTMMVVHRHALITLLAMLSTYWNLQ